MTGVQTCALPIFSQPTECGTLYSKKELSDIAALCREYALAFYIDGARLAYALSSPKNDVTLSDLAAVSDAFYIGGTKCGRGGGFKISIEDKTEKVYNIPYGAIILVSIGDQLKPGDQITKGPLNPNDILKYQGVQGVYQYLLKEVQRVYKNQGVDINDKHIEVIVSRMLSKYRVADPGETYLISS